MNAMYICITQKYVAFVYYIIKGIYYEENYRFNGSYYALNDNLR